MAYHMTSLKQQVLVFSCAEAASHYPLYLSNYLTAYLPIYQMIYAQVYQTILPLFFPLACLLVFQLACLMPCLFFGVMAYLNWMVCARVTVRTGPPVYVQSHDQQQHYHQHR